jgi:hypothetical protein
MSSDFTLGVCGAVEPNITFLENAGKEVMRIDKNGVTISPEIPLDEAAQHVINALDAHIQHLVRSEREACAKVCDRMAPIYEDLGGSALESAAESIRARGKA